MGQHNSRAERRRTKAELKQHIRSYLPSNRKPNKKDFRFVSQIERLLEFSEKIGDLNILIDSIRVQRNSLDPDSLDYERRFKDIRRYTMQRTNLIIKRDRKPY